jgi:uncharacterized membrane protein
MSTASIIIAVMIHAVNTFETSVKFYLQEAVSQKAAIFIFAADRT